MIFRSEMGRSARPICPTRTRCESCITGFGPASWSPASRSNGASCANSPISERKKSRLFQPARSQLPAASRQFAQTLALHLHQSAQRRQRSRRCPGRPGRVGRTRSKLDLPCSRHGPHRRPTADQGPGSRPRRSCDLARISNRRARPLRQAIFLLPSHREGLPNALLEAMAEGLICVARMSAAWPRFGPRPSPVTPGRSRTGYRPRLGRRGPPRRD